MVRLILKLWDSATFLWGEWSHVFYLNFDPPIPKLLKLFVIPDPLEIFLYMYPMNHNDFMGFVLFPVAWRFQHFMKKHWKWTAPLPLSSASCFSITQAWFFIMLYSSEV